LRELSPIKPPIEPHLLKFPPSPNSANLVPKPLTYGPLGLFQSQTLWIVWGFLTKT
jgi:hypothetical protein